jgi:hypothetical protein
MCDILYVVTLVMTYCNNSGLDYGDVTVITFFFNYGDVTVG